MMSPKEFAVLFVCTGNICRSPTAHAIFECAIAHAGLAPRVAVDSAGISAYHAGDRPDPRSLAVALAHGLDMQAMRGRQFVEQDWLQFDLILVAGRDHLLHLQRRMPLDWPGRLALMLDDAEVPDPYYGGAADFEAVFTLLQNRSQYWLTAVYDSLSTI